MNNFGITTKELKQHYKLLEAANKSLDLLGLLVEKKRYISDAKSLGAGLGGVALAKSQALTAIHCVSHGQTAKIGRASCRERV